ncbi:MAG: Ig-like domain-containing protein [Thermoleophilia bacterium]
MNSSFDSVTNQARPRAGLRRRLLPGALAALLLSAVIFAAGCGTETETADPATADGGKLEIAETTYDFGAVPVGETVTRSFEIRNAGDGTLRLGELEVKRLEGC